MSTENTALYNTELVSGKEKPSRGKFVLPAVRLLGQAVSSKNNCIWPAPFHRPIVSCGFPKVRPATYQLKAVRRTTLLRGMRGVVGIRRGLLWGGRETHHPPSPHFVSSFFHCLRSVFGATMRARLTSALAKRPERKAAHCIVFPRPMSSARMPPLRIL